MMRSLTDFLIDLPRFAKRVLMLMLDVLLCFVSIQVSFFLRLGEWQAINSGPLYATIVALPLAIPLFITQGLYRAIFRYSTTAALQAIARSTILFGLVYVAIFTFVGVAGVPRTIGIIGPILLFLFVAGSRVFADWLLGSTYRLRIGDAQHSRAVIYGVGDAGRQLAMALGRTPDLKVVGFVAEEVSLRGATLAGLPVYAPEDLQLLAETEKIDELLLAAPELSRTRRTEIVQQVADIGLHVRTIPSMTDIARGKISVADLKEVAIEDLLSRQPVPPDEELLGVTIRDRVVMVTGAGGSIGSELCRQIWDLQPARLLLVDSAEYNLYLIHEELTARKLKSNSTIEVVPYLGSVRDEGRMEEIMRHERPQTIYHAAAYKHVPLVEANPKEGLSNNVFGTWVLIGVASRMGTEYFILVSSDKAVRPTNVMGATKRMAELIVQAHARRQPDRKFSMVRFGNVLGSSGSVVPKFREQIAAGGPVTITHPEMTRYFMTIPEAAQLVLQAGAMTEGGEVFVLNMGEPVKILELARNMIRLSGLTVRDEQNVDGDIAIQTIGIRRGEKLFEELLIGDNPELSSHPRIMKARESELSWDQMRMAIEDLEEALNCNNIDAALGVLRRIVKEYRPKKQDFSDDKSDDLFLTVN